MKPPPPPSKGRSCGQAAPTLRAIRTSSPAASVSGWPLHAPRYSNPKLLVADEPVSMLDVSVRAGILRLLKRLVVEQQMAMVFITHDLSIVAHICDDLAVMYRGAIVEQGPVRDLLLAPAHPYTQALIDAVPILSPTAGPRALPGKLLAGAGSTPPERRLPVCSALRPCGGAMRATNPGASARAARSCGGLPQGS